MEDIAAGRPYVRMTNVDEFDTLVEMQRRAFIASADPVFNYFGSVKQPVSNDVDSSERRNLETFFRFLTRSCYMAGARITVVAVPWPDGDRLCAACIWFPPCKRISLWKTSTLIRGGLLKTLKGWGMNGLFRVGIEYSDICEKALKQAYKDKGVKKSPETSWYLQLACTDPDAQGKGYMSLLCREAFSYAPSSIFTLEATTAKSRDQYEHFGYEVFQTIQLGEGKVNEKGLPAKGADATGLTIYSMVKWK